MLGGGRVIAFLAEQQSEEMEQIGVVGIGLEQVLIDGLSGVEAVGGLVSASLCDGLLDGDPGRHYEVYIRKRGRMVRGVG